MRIALPGSFWASATPGQRDVGGAVARIDRERAFHQVGGAVEVAGGARGIALRQQGGRTGVDRGRRALAMQRRRERDNGQRGGGRDGRDTHQHLQFTGHGYHGARSFATKKPSVASSSGVNRAPGPRAVPIVGRLGGPALVRGQEALDLIRALLIEQRTDDVGQRPARLDQGRGQIEQPRLQIGQRVEPRVGQPPARLRIAPPGAGARARRIDQHVVGLPDIFGQRLRLTIGIEQPGRDDRHPGSLGARQQPRQAATIGIAGEDTAFVVHRRGQRERLAPRPRA